MNDSHRLSDLRSRRLRRRWLLTVAMIPVLSVASAAALTALEASPAFADTVIDGCTVVANPTASNFTNCPGTNFAGTDLSGVNLSYANLTGSTFATCTLAGQPPNFYYQCETANLDGTNLSQANLANATMNYADTSPVPFLVIAVPTMVGTTLVGTNLSNTDLAGVDLANDDLTGANLTGVVFEVGNRFFVSLAGANLTGTIFVPSNQTVAATGPSGATVTWPTPASAPGVTPGVCTPPSGSQFPIGTTTVTCPVYDPAGAAATGTFLVSVESAPVITSQPSSVSVPSGQTAQFAAAATGGTDLSVQWQLSINGGATWYSVTGLTSPSFTTGTLTSAENGWQVRAVFTNVAGSATTNAATITVVANSAPVVTLQPASQSVPTGHTITFSAAATGSPTPTVQWQLSINGGATWYSVTGLTSPSFTTGTLTSAENGWQVRAVFTNVAGSATTNAATITVVANSAPVVTLQPASQSVPTGHTITFSAAATGSPTPTVQWQLSINGGATWYSVTGLTSPSFTTGTLTSAENGWQVRAVFTNVAGSATTKAATIIVT